MFKLLGNSGYGKLIEALARQTNVIYTKDEKVVDRALRSAHFSDLDEVGQAYELESRKPRITIRRPFQIGIAVYQLAKLPMLEFYYDFLDRYFDIGDFELIQMDTDSNYMAISAKRRQDIVRPELQTEFAAKKEEWLAWDKWSGRTPGLFKLECEGSRMITLCSKCYFIEEPEGEKKKFSTKGMPKKQNEITWQRFKSALDGSKDMATNRGFRMRDGQMVTYEQQKLGLSSYYEKRWVLPDGIHTEPYRISHLVSVGRRENGIGRDNQQFFADKDALGAIAQIVDNWFIWFPYSFFDLVNFQRPDWICGPFRPTFKFTRLEQIPDIHARGELFFVNSNRS